MRSSLPSAVAREIDRLKEEYGVESVHVDPSKLPEELRDAVELIEGLAVSDDGVRDALSDLLCAHPEGEAVSRLIAPFRKAMWQWLFDPSLPAGLTPEKDAVLCLQMLVDLLSIRERASSGAR